MGKETISSGVTTIHNLIGIPCKLVGLLYQQVTRQRDSPTKGKGTPCQLSSNRSMKTSPTFINSNATERYVKCVHQNELETALPVNLITAWD